MFSAPKKCLNRLCKSELYKECILGYLPLNGAEVQVIVRCYKCKDTFAIPQMAYSVQNYTTQLSNNPHLVKIKENISDKEHAQVKNILYQGNPLKDLSSSKITE